MPVNVRTWTNWSIIKLELKNKKKPLVKKKLKSKVLLSQFMYNIFRFSRFKQGKFDDEFGHEIFNFIFWNKLYTFKNYIKGIDYWKYMKKLWLNIDIFESRKMKYVI